MDGLFNSFKEPHLDLLNNFCLQAKILENYLLLCALNPRVTPKVNTIGIIITIQEIHSYPELQAINMIEITRNATKICISIL
jgi:hypothetical protein